MKRICPFCKSNMHSNSVYYCISCGNVLPESLQLKDLPFTKIKKLDFVKKSRVNKKNTKELFSKVAGDVPSDYLIIGITLFVLFIVGFYFLVRSSNLSISKILGDTQNTEVTESSVSTVTEIVNNTPKNIVEIDIDARSGIFGQKEIYNFIPYDADFYIEVSDIGTLDSYFSFMGGEFFTLTESLKGNVSSSYSAFFVNKEGSRGWVFILFPLEAGFNPGTFAGITVGRVGGALVISKQASLINDVSTSRSGVTKSLSLNSNFIKIRNNIPVEGKLFMISLTEEGNSVISDLTRDTSSVEFKSIIGNFESAESKYLIIK